MLKEIEVGWFWKATKSNDAGSSIKQTKFQQGLALFLYIQHADQSLIIWEEKRGKNNWRRHTLTSKRGREAGQRKVLLQNLTIWVSKINIIKNSSFYVIGNMMMLRKGAHSLNRFLSISLASMMKKLKSCWIKLKKKLMRG